MLSTAIPESGDKSSKKSRFTNGVNTVMKATTDEAITSQLSRANLLKLRGQWEEAVAVCTDAIRRAPDSAAAHALLGDIYLAQGKGDDALHWYRMALDRNAQQPGVQEKHDKLIADKRARITGSMGVSQILSTHKTLVSNADKTTEFSPSAVPTLTTKLTTTTGSYTIERTLEWFDRLFPSGNNDRFVRVFYMISGLLTVLVLVGGVVVLMAGHKNDSSDGTPVVISDVSTIQASNTIATAPQVNPLPAIPAAPSPLPSPEQTLLQQLSVLNSDELTITSAQADKERSQVQLEIALIAHSHESVLATRNRILQNSATVARAAFVANPTLQRFSVRILLRSSGAIGTPDAVNANLIFVGETTSTALHMLTTTSPVPDYRLLSSLFTNTWWANGLSEPNP